MLPRPRSLNGLDAAVPTRESKALVPSRAALLSGVEDSLRRLAYASERGFHTLLAEAEQAIVRGTGASGAFIVINSGGEWRRWDRVGESSRGGGIVTLPKGFATATVPASFSGDLFVPVRVGTVAAVVTAPRTGKETESIASLLAVVLGLALTALERERLDAGDLDELDVMQRVALRILKSHDLAEILLLITHETQRLLAADICGIMLRDGDAVVMQRCVGNLSADTASLRMQAGQGVAGRVFATKKPCHVENYVASNLISADFMNLARVEGVRSALAAPLMSQNDVIGVLEVWRRQPTEFAEHHTQRLVTLANLTSLAIENANLSQARDAMVEELATTNRALVERYEVIRSSAAFHNELIRMQLDGKNLHQVAAQSAERLDADVLILDTNLAIEGAAPAREEVPEAMRAAIKAAVRDMKGPAETLTVPFESRTLALRCASAGAERLGLVVVVCSEVDEGVELTLTQICTATALHLIERRAAGRARAETLSTVLWDLLEGSEEVRRFALARARELRIDLDGRQRVYLCNVEGLEQYASSEGWSASDLSAGRRRIAQTYRGIAGLTSSVRLAGMRGNLIALICAGNAVSDAGHLGQEFAAATAAQIPGLSAHVGISAAYNSPTALSAAFREARISVEVARQRDRIAAATYEEAGIVGVLLSLRDEADVRKLVRTIFGPLLDEKPDDCNRLLRTLAAFFEVNCSRVAAAELLGVHEKTVAYRLGKIRDLTGLDFGKHEKRVLADIALRMHGMTDSDRGWTSLGARDASRTKHLG